MAETETEVAREDADPTVIGEHMIGEESLGGIEDDTEPLPPELASDPDLATIHGGDISETPAAHPGTRGGGTGADEGTGGEIGTTRPATTTVEEETELDL